MQNIQEIYREHRRVTQVYREHLKAKQQQQEDPCDFATYLNHLEQQFLKDPDAHRAMFFFVRLLPDLQVKMEMCRPTLPSTRREMVEYAAQCWDMLELGKRQPKKRRGKKCRRSTFNNED